MPARRLTQPRRYAVVAHDRFRHRGVAEADERLGDGALTRSADLVATADDRFTPKRTAGQLRRFVHCDTLRFDVVRHMDSRRGWAAACFGEAGRCAG